ncbi:MAG: hypothetical protein IH874_04195 [Candidatus Dadabacteria bacterium]|nr:hypothetical protein [Candidatus Dadabacteria bacterium]
MDHNIFRGWKKRFLGLVVFLTVAACSVGDDDSPARIGDLSFEPSARILNWTAPGDDDREGAATVYDLRFFEDFEIASLLGLPNLDGVGLPEISAAMINNFSAATQIQREVSPEEAGTPQSFVVDRLDIFGLKRFFFALVARDEVGNESPPSNVVEVEISIASVQFHRTAEQSCFGSSSANGDFNDDRIEDILIGDPCAGMVFLFYGKNDLVTSDLNGDGVFDLDGPDSADVTIIGDPAEAFGAAVSKVFDFVDDQSDEIAIGSPEFAGGRGRVVIINGDENNLPPVIDLTAGDSPDFIITGENPGDNFGFSIADTRNVITVLDRNILVGAPGFDSSTGRVYLIDAEELNDNSSAAEAIATFDGETPGDMFGFDVEVVGDMDDEGFDEFGVGAPGAGKVYVFFVSGGINNIDLAQSIADVTVITGDPSEGFGTAFSGGGDIDGVVVSDIFGVNEGPSDLVVGVPGDSMGTGAVLLYSGDDVTAARGTGVSPAVKTRYMGDAPGDRFGASVSVLGDMNPDIQKTQEEGGIILDLLRGNSDFAVGAPGTPNGTVYVFFGSPSLPGVVDAEGAAFTIEGDEPGEKLGITLEALGDVTGDNENDFAASGNNVTRVVF